MNSILEEKVRAYLKKLKEILNNPNHIINICDNRDKNYIFYYLYNIDKAYIEQVLNSLEASNFVEILINKNSNFPPNELYVFNKEVELVNQAGQEEEINLYIKLSIDEIVNRIITVSFHNASYSFN